MLERYKTDEMNAIWTEENKFNTYLKVELLASEAWYNLDEVPKEDILKLWANASFDVKRIKEIEKETHHDIVAFTRAVSETLGEEKKWIHYGLTSTDVVDTAYASLYKQANDILEKDLEAFMAVLKKQALKYQHTACMGRTHGVHAEITSFGLKFALYYDEFKRNMKRFKEARSDIETGKISGAVGTFANTPPFVQDYVCEKLEINSANISTQVLERDNHANYFSTLALIATSMEKIATEIRHLQRTEVREVEESENICGCARVMRGYMLTSYENMPLWHERDISHSSAERIIAADATCLLDYMLKRYTKVLDKLTVFEDRMLKNIYITNGVIFSQRFMLKLVEKGLSREESYDLVQPLAIKSWEENLEFRKLILESKVSELLTKDEIEDCFDVRHHLKNVEIIYRRVGLV